MMYNHSRLLHLKSAKANMVHRKDIRKWLIKLLCSPHQPEDRAEIAVAEYMDIEDLSIVILSRNRLSYLDELCEAKGVVGSLSYFRPRRIWTKRRPASWAMAQATLRRHCIGFSLILLEVSFPVSSLLPRMSSLSSWFSCRATWPDHKGPRPSCAHAHVAPRNICQRLPEHERCHCVYPLSSRCFSEHGYPSHRRRIQEPQACGCHALQAVSSRA